MVSKDLMYFSSLTSPLTGKFPGSGSSEEREREKALEDNVVSFLMHRFATRTPVSLHHHRVKQRIPALAADCCSYECGEQSTVLFFLSDSSLCQIRSKHVHVVHKLLPD